MNDKNQSANSGKIACPGKGHESNGRHVVNEHFPKVFAFDVNELGNAEGPIEAKLDHVVVPNVPIYGMVRIVVPAIFDVPQPGFVP